MTKLKDTGLTLNGCCRCHVCSSIKPSAEFYKDASRYTGYSSRCKLCENSRNRTDRPERSLVRELKALADKHPRRYADILLGAAGSLQAA